MAAHRRRCRTAGPDLGEVWLDRPLTMRGEFARWGDRMNLGRWHERCFDVCRDQRNRRPCVGILLCSVARHCDPEPDNCDPAILDRHVLTLDKA